MSSTCCRPHGRALRGFEHITVAPVPLSPHNLLLWRLWTGWPVPREHGPRTVLTLTQVGALGGDHSSAVKLEVSPPPIWASVPSPVR